MSSSLRYGTFFDNIIASIFFIFLPFTYALALNVGFPLKISELALFAIVLIGLQTGRVKIPLIHSATYKIFAVFLIFTLISMVVNLFWVYDYSLMSYESRFGYKFDSVLKFVYLCLSFGAFIVASNAFFLNERKYIKFFLFGGLLAGSYSWYLFFSGLFHLSPFLLPAIDEPQSITVSIGTFIRSGLFKEGNFMALYILFCIILSFYSGKKKLGYFFMATLITTFSTMGFLSASIFIICYSLKNLLTRQGFLKSISVFVVMISSFVVMLGNEDFRILVISKFSINNDKISNIGDFSRADRLNSAWTGLRMGLANPFLGVGISNYSLHSVEFNHDSRFKNANSDFKGIPNNVYVEIFSETGAIGLMCFLYLLYLLYGQTKYDTSGTLRYGFMSTLIYFVAFPTFSILYIWVFFGLITAQPTLASQEKTTITSSPID